MRKPIRTDVADALKLQSATAYRAHEADKLMDEGDPEPPHLYSENVMRQARHEVVNSNFVHKDPILAISTLKHGPLCGFIHSIGIDPIFVHFWSNHQINMYRSSVKAGHVALSIDATGGICKKIKKLNGDISHHIFLYNRVIQTASGPWPVFHMVSEIHHTNAIANWLGEWKRMNVPIPPEVVCDGSKAILNAVIRVFAGFLSIQEYADAYIRGTVGCYIRMDVAHFIKCYAKFLGQVRNKSIKTFYIAAIGQLVLCDDVDKAYSLLVN